jgi:hypothetical protein
MLSDERTHNAKKPTPETRNSTSGATDWCWESLRSPTIQHGIEHGLEEIFHDVKANVRSRTIDGAEEEDAYTHHGRGDDHGPFAADTGDLVRCCTKKDTDDTREVDVDVRSISVPKREIKGTVLDSQNLGKERT